MDTLLASLYGQAVLLLVPGPTNALLATSGATVGVYRSLPLLLFELLGYETAVALARLLLAPALAHLPWGSLLLRALAAAYLVGLSVVLWRTQWTGSTRLIRGHHMFVTTLLNPKTLLTALVLWPARHDGLAWSALTAMLPVAATVWLWIGSVAGQAASQRITRLIPKFSSVTLGVFAALLLGSLLSPVLGSLRR